jgi:hypothetical protein
VRVALTGRGETRLDAVRAAKIAVVAQGLAALDDPDRTAIGRALGRLDAIVGEAGRGG